MAEPPAKKVKQDGNLALVDSSILLAAQDPEKWIAERRKNWPSRARVAEKLANEAARNDAKEAGGSGDQGAGKSLTGEKAGSGDAAEQTAGGSGKLRPVCRFFLRGRCNAGDKCRFRHERDRPRPAPHERVYKRFEAPPNTSLFVRLVQTDQLSEDERFLHFLQHLARFNRI